jgi:tRNA-2-methylthio-N6-dimethylallyladenosine synthase
MRVFLETFGCQMNELDSELVRGRLASLGYRFVDDPDAAEIVLFNTCAVRDHAEQKVRSRVGIVGSQKRNGREVILGLLGCMAEREGLEILQKHPQVDLLCGPGELDRLPMLLDNLRRTSAADRSERVALAGNRSRRTATLAAAEDALETLDLSRSFDPEGTRRPWSAYVRITRGCNKFCTYCVVPATRGAEVHRPPDAIVEEPQVGPGLAAFRKAPPAGQRITTFAMLLARIHEEVPGLERLRFVTSYPRDLGEDVFDVLATCPRICRYLHMPVQSGSDRILKAMNRGYTVGEYLETVDRAIERLPDVSIAGDIIVGFPTETDEDFAATERLMRRVPFKNNFIFKYSPRPGTTAFDRLPDDVPDELKRYRNNRLLALQAEISRDVHAKEAGRSLGVLFDRVGSVPIERRAPGPASGGTVELRVAGRSSDSRTPEFQTPVPSDRRRWQALGRTGGDLIVAVDVESPEAAESLLGTVATVHIDSAESLLLHGHLPTPATTPIR